MPHKPVITLLLACAAMMATPRLFAQSKIKYESEDGAIVAITTGDSLVVSTGHFAAPRSSAQSRRLIVQLAGEPLARTAKTGRSVAGRRSDDEHQKFRSDFNAIRVKASSARGLPSEIHSEFKTVFNGFSVTASPEVEAAIRSLSYVKAVHEDLRVRAFDHTSNSIIGADKVWANYGMTGSGMVICIIDTGIDYLHPDLGGGIGAGFKVIGGYDFANSDSDPHDDHGHGTHVAGIAAANGGIKGVAPDAKLLAFKVLAADGYGLDSWILAAIERTVDPDQNPATDDAPDVVNMSLGRSAGQWDPFSEAIANATREGVTFVVAAGNDYVYQAIGTPAAAADAITVGATTFADQVAAFSSKGPTNDYRLKPDVCAPGDGINSTWPGNGYTWLSGTSMASPHVAGAAALLLQKNPSWSPAHVKAALMNTATRIATASHWDAGTGRIDLEKAFAAKLVMSPASFSLGRTNGTALQTSVFKATITNHDITARTLTVGVDGPLFDAGVTAAIQPSNLSIAPGGSAEITLTFTIDPSSLQAVNFIRGYAGAIVLTGENDVLRAPVSLIHAPGFRIEFSEPMPGSVLYADPTRQLYGWITPTSRIMEPLIGEGNFDFVAVYDGGGKRYVVLAEDVSTSSDTTVLLTKARAKNKITTAFRDKDGKPIEYDYTKDSGATFLGTRGWSIYSNYSGDSYISDNRYATIFHSLMGTRDGVPYSIIQRTTTGCHRSEDVSNYPADFSRISFAAPSSDYKQKMVQSMVDYYGTGGLNMIHFDDIAGTEIFYTAPPDQTSGLGFVAMEIPGSATGRLKSPYLGFDRSRNIRFVTGLNNPRFGTVHQKSLQAQPFGGKVLQNSANMVVEDGSVTFKDFKFHYGEGGAKAGNVSFSQALENGIRYLFWNSNDADYNFYLRPVDLKLPAVVPDRSKFILEYDAHIFTGVAGTAKTELYTAADQNDRVPPLINRLSLTSAGVETDLLKEGGPNIFVVNISDCANPDECGNSITGDVTLKVRRSGDEWQAQNLTEIKGEAGALAASLSVLPEGVYSLQVSAEDQAGNAVTFEASPAFRVEHNDEPGVWTMPLYPADHAAAVTRTPSFQWLSSAPSASYVIQVSTGNEFDTADEHVVNDLEFELTDPLDPAQVYYWRVRHVDDTEWSPVFEFTTIDDTPVILIAPANHSVVSGALEMLWSGESSYDYQVQLSVDSDFSTIFLDEIVHGTLMSSFLDQQNNTRFYWRVRRYIASDDGVQFGIWSEVFDFQLRGTIKLLAPLDGYAFATLRPLFWWTTLNATSYTIELSRSVDFTSVQSFNVDSPGYRWLADLNLATKYYWRVRAEYAGVHGDWSDVSSFATAPTLPMELLAPVNGATRVPSSRVFFYWYTTAPAAKLQISATPTFESLMYESGDLVTQSAFVPLLPNKTFFWRVVPVFHPGNATIEYGQPSAVFDLTTTDHVDLVSPSDFSTDVDPGAARFEWNFIYGAQEYDLSISKTQNFSVIEPGHARSVGSLTEFVSDLEPGTTYYWRVHTRSDMVPEVVKSQVYSFTTLSVTGNYPELDKGSIYISPNPSREKTTVAAFLRAPGEIFVTVQDTNGRVVATVRQMDAGVGWNEVILNTATLSDGMYFCKVATDGATEVQKMVVSH